MKAEIEQNVVDKKSDEIKRKNLLIENENLIVACLSNELLYSVMNDVNIVSRFSAMNDAYTEKRSEADLILYFKALDYQNTELAEKAQLKGKMKCVTMDTVKPKVLAPGVNCFTEVSWSKPRSNKKNNRILPAKSDNKKKVEAQPRNNKSNLNQKNCVDSSISSKHLEVAFKKHLCYVRYVDGVELLKGSRGSNLYTISVEDMMKSSPICLLSKASKNKSWLWHHRLNHLNFDTINDLAQKDLVRGLPRLKFEKDQLCSACQLGKSMKYTHKPKYENTIMEVLHTFHMDLCGPIKVQSINGKKYILVIVDDYSRFTWIKFLRSKDETLEFVIKFLKQIQVGLNKTEHNLLIKF
ncbi:retrovirus-related pol polyprotein from transposon TNT 1-94 [Tanacetum coccineum]